METIESIIKKLESPMYRMALVFTGDSHKAKDIVQEGLMRVWKYKDKLAEIENIKAWSLRIVKNLCIDHSRKVKYDVQPIEASLFLASTVPDPDDRAILNDQMTILQAAMKTLNPKQQMAIQLRDIEGHSYQEIGEMMNEHINQVKILIHRGRHKLKSYIIAQNNYGTSED